MAAQEEMPGNWELYRYNKDNKDAIAQLALNTVSAGVFQQYQTAEAERYRTIETRVKNLEDIDMNRKRTASAQWFAIAIAIITGALSVASSLIVWTITR